MLSDSYRTVIKNTTFRMEPTQFSSQPTTYSAFLIYKVENTTVPTSKDHEYQRDNPRAPSSASLPILLLAQDTGWEGTGVTRSPQECTTGNSARQRPLSLTQLRKNTYSPESVCPCLCNCLSLCITHTHTPTEVYTLEQPT